jgi:methanogenic corrinoid protein MtbC1
MEMVDRVILEGKDPFVVLEECRSGMEKAGELFSSGEYFLSELMLSADMFKKITAKLEPLMLGKKTGPARESVVIVTPKGDIHDIGKNIAATVFKAGGFEVHDLGVDISPQDIVDQVARTGARIVGMSALITPTFQSMKDVVDLMNERNLIENIR